MSNFSFVKFNSFKILFCFFLLKVYGSAVYPSCSIPEEQISLPQNKGIVLLLENYTTIMTITTCATLILIFVVVGLFSFVMFLMFDANSAAKTHEENQNKISNSKENDE